MSFRPLPYLAAVLSLAVVYFGAAKLGLSLAVVAEQVTVVWPATGIALSALLLFGFRLWPAIMLGAFLANAMANEPYAVAASIAVGNTLEAIAGCWLLRRLIDFRPSLERLKDVLGLVGLAAALSTMLSATIGVTALCAGGVHPWSTFGHLWFTWWLGDAMGNLVVAPLLLTWVAWRRVAWPPRRVVEAACLAGGLALVSALVFTSREANAARNSMEYTIFPFIIWAALRFGQQGTATVILAALSVAILGTVDHRGPFAGGPMEESLTLLQFYMAVVAITAFLLGAVVSERRMAERRRMVGYAVTAALAEARSLADAAPRLLRLICESLDWDFSALWFMDREANALRCVDAWHSDAVHVPVFEADTRQRRLAPGVGLPGRVWLSGQPAWIADVARDTNFPRAAVASCEGLHGAFGFPIILGKEVLGTLEFFSRQIQQPDKDLLRMLAAIGSQIGLFIERSLAEDRVRFQAHMLDNIGQATVAVRPDGAVFYWNRFAETLYGWTAEEILGRNILDFVIHTADRGEAAARMDRLRGGEKWCGEARVQRRDGATFAALITDTPVCDERGQVVGIIGISIDISARKRAEDSSRFLADAGATLAALVDRDSTLQKVAALAVPAFAEGCIVDMLQADGSLGTVAAAHIDPAEVERIRGFSHALNGGEDLAHGPVHVLRTGKPELVPEVADAHTAGAPHNSEHLGLLRARGVTSYIGVPLTVRGKTIGVLTFVASRRGRCYDAADLGVAEELARRTSIALENARLYAEVREADRRKDEFLAMLAHELRNPLAPIRNAVHILKLPGIDGPTSERARDMMERQVQHMVRLVDDLLDVSRIMRGRIELRKERIDLAVAVARAVETAHPAIETGGHELTVSMPPEPILLEADTVRLAQVISNLLNNAAKYTERGGRISLAAEHAGASAIVRVRDTGIGIATDMLPRIFDLFVQANRSLDRAQGGMGIGLTLVKSLVEMHEGSVGVHSAGPGKGSEFFIRLPALPREVAIDMPSKQTAASSIVEPRPPRQRILVVDDNVDAAASLAILLRLQGQEVGVANDGPAALAAARTQTPDVVFLDIGMPGMDGYEVARQFRQQTSLQNVLLVALTGWGQEEDRRRTREAGFDHHIVKPVEPEQLQAILRGNDVPAANRGNDKR